MVILIMLSHPQVKSDITSVCLHSTLENRLCCPYVSSGAIIFQEKTKLHNVCVIVMGFSNLVTNIKDSVCQSFTKDVINRFSCIFSSGTGQTLKQ